MTPTSKHERGEESDRPIHRITAEDMPIGDHWQMIGQERYCVSRTGVVFSLHTGRVVSQFNSNGYQAVCLFLDGKDKRQLVHRLVATAFVPYPGEGNEVNHKDGNRRNNHADNLEWVTHQENIQHARDVLGTVGKHESHAQVKLSWEKVRKIREARSAGVRVKDLAAYWKISETHISAICNGKEWKE
jgi:hypothetical protein